MIKLTSLLNVTVKQFKANVFSNNLLAVRCFSSNICWKCGSENKHDFFCNSCQVIQKPSFECNYFKLFGLEEQFRVDEKALKDKFRQLQSLLHPDKFSNKTDEEKVISEEYSSLLNRAYTSLQTPLNRAVHLLKLKGEEIGESESENVKDPDFLMEVMTLNEEVEDAEKDVEKLKNLNEKNRRKLLEISEEIDKNFQTNNVQIAKENIAKMRYYSSLDKRINGTLRELGVTD